MEPNLFKIFLRQSCLKIVAAKFLNIYKKCLLTQYLENKTDPLYLIRNHNHGLVIPVSNIQHNTVLDTGCKRATVPEFLPTENHRSEEEPVQTPGPGCLLTQHWQRVRCLACKNTTHASRTICSCCRPIFVKIL